MFQLTKTHETAASQRDSFDHSKNMQRWYKCSASFNKVVNGYFWNTNNYIYKASFYLIWERSCGTSCKIKNCRPKINLDIDWYSCHKNLMAQKGLEQLMIDYFKEKTMKIMPEDYFFWEWKHLKSKQDFISLLLSLLFSDCILVLFFNAKNIFFKLSSFLCE